MSADMIVILVTVLVPSVGVAAYFWVADRREVRESSALADAQDVSFVLNGDYRPACATVAEDRAIRLHVTNEHEDGQTWDYLDFPYLWILHEIPGGETVTVDLPPLESGEYVFFSGVGGARGTLLVESKEDSG